jgi:hypothetical protein
MKPTLLAFYLLLLTSLRAQVPFAWEADASQARPAQKDVYRGETVALRPSWTGEGVDTNGWTFTLYWQTNGMGAAWWSDATNAFSWTPERDCGADAYTLFVRAATSNGVSYRANARLRMLASPGFDPADAPEPSYYPALASDVSPYVFSLLAPSFATTQQLADASNSLAGALLEHAANRVTRLQTDDGKLWQDATGGVWSVSMVVTASVLRVVFSDDFFSDVRGPPPQSYYGWSSGFIDGVWSGETVLGAHMISDGAGAMWLGAWPSVDPEIIYPSTLIPDAASAHGTAVVGMVDLGYMVTSRTDGVLYESILPGLTNGFVSAGQTTNIAAAAAAQATAGMLTNGQPNVSLPLCVLSNATLSGRTTLPNSQPTNLVMRLFLSNDVILTEEVFQ